MPKIKKVREIPSKVKEVRILSQGEKPSNPTKKPSLLEQEVKDAKQELVEEVEKIENLTGNDEAKLVLPAPAPNRAPSRAVQKQLTETAEQETETSVYNNQREPYSSPTSSYTTQSPRSSRPRAYESVQEQMTRIENPVRAPTLATARPDRMRDIFTNFSEDSVISSQSEREIAPNSESRYNYRPKTIEESGQRRRRTDFL